MATRFYSEWISEKCLKTIRKMKIKLYLSRYHRRYDALVFPQFFWSHSHLFDNVRIINIWFKEDSSWIYFSIPFRTFFGEQTFLVDKTFHAFSTVSRRFFVFLLFERLVEAFLKQWRETVLNSTYHCTKNEVSD